MPSLLFEEREIVLRVAFWGPEQAGRTSLLESLRRELPAGRELHERPLDSAPVGSGALLLSFLAGEAAGFRVRLVLRVPPSGEEGRALRRASLEGIDGLVFVADSREERLAADAASLRELREGLRAAGLGALPALLLLNKRDLPTALPEAVLEAALDLPGARSHPLVAPHGGVLPLLEELARRMGRLVERGLAGEGHLPSQRGPFRLEDEERRWLETARQRRRVPSVLLLREEWRVDEAREERRGPPRLREPPPAGRGLPAPPRPEVPAEESPESPTPPEAPAGAPRLERRVPAASLLLAGLLLGVILGLGAGWLAWGLG